MEKDVIQTKIKIHDGIVGATYLLSIILAVTLDIQWLYLAGAVAVLQIMSTFTGFCPVYYGLNKFMQPKRVTKAASKPL